jgi:thiamine biosynthesis lipoprotein
MDAARRTRCTGRACRASPLAAVCLSLTLVACEGRAPQVVQFDGPTMGTYYSVKVVRPPPGRDPVRLRAGIERVLAQVNREISTYDESSELSRLNRNPSTDWIAVSERLLVALREAQRVSRLSGGAFDVTIGPLVNLWGFGPEPGAERLPSAEDVRRARARVGFERLRLRQVPPGVRKQRGDVYVDLSALGEGYGADRMAGYLESEGVRDYMVAIAGAIRVKGRNAAGRPWAIAVETPTPGRREAHRVIRVADGGLSTSGDYRNFFERDGRRYSHEIDPHTGEPVTHRLASVTVVSDSAMRADALATALMVLGDEKGPRLAAAERLAAFFIVRSGAGLEETSTPAFDRYLAP